MIPSGLRIVHPTTITSSFGKVNETTTPSPSSTWDVVAHGFDAGADYYGNTSSFWSEPFGSIADADYYDGDNFLRTISSCYWIPASGPWGFMLNPQALTFSLNATSVPNTDATFFKLVIDGTEFLRSSATYQASFDGGTQWWWTGVTTDPFLGANPDDFEVWAE